MNDEDKKNFLDDFKKLDLQKKFDMWCYALEQESICEELLSEMSSIGNELKVNTK